MSDDDGYTTITDQHGTRRVKMKPRKRRASPRAIRLAELEAGQCLIHRSKARWQTMPPPAPGMPIPANSNWQNHERGLIGMAIVEHRWFDPVAGEANRWAGEMAGIRSVTHRGRTGGLTGKTLRGLAQAGYHLATPEQAALIIAFADERDDITREWQAGRLTRDEAVLMATPIWELMRGLGLEDEYREMMTKPPY